MTTQPAKQIGHKAQEKLFAPHTLNFKGTFLRMRNSRATFIYQLAKGEKCLQFLSQGARVSSAKTQQADWSMRGTRPVLQREKTRMRGAEELRAYSDLITVAKVDLSREDEVNTLFSNSKIDGMGMPVQTHHSIQSFPIVTGHRLN